MEFGHMTTKDEVLSALVATWKIQPNNDSEMAHEDMVKNLEERAVELGATSFEIIETQFQGTPEEDRQLLLEVCVEELEDSIENSIEYLQDLAKIRDEFHLKDPFSK